MRSGLLICLGLLLAGCAGGGKKAAPVQAEPPKARLRPAARPLLPPRPVKLDSGTIILTYHDMVPSRDRTSLWFDCTPRELESQLDWLARQGAVFVSVKDVVDGLMGKTVLPRKAVAVCFADNYQGFCDHAWPILKRKRIPVTLFVHTAYVGSRIGRPKMSWQTLRSLVKEGRGLASVESQTATHPLDLTALSPAQREKEFKDSRRAILDSLGTLPALIAYPNGKQNRSVADEAWRAGYSAGFTESQHPAEDAPTIMEIPRYVHTKYRQAWMDAQRRERDIKARPGTYAHKDGRRGERAESAIVQPSRDER